jgi:hypothetical protein
MFFDVSLPLNFIRLRLWGKIANSMSDYEGLYPEAHVLLMSQKKLIL